jgi:hypothetical protein
MNVLPAHIFISLNHSIRSGVGFVVLCINMRTKSDVSHFALKMETANFSEMLES